MRVETPGIIFGTNKTFSSERTVRRSTYASSSAELIVDFGMPSSDDDRTEPSRAVHMAMALFTHVGFNNILASSSRAQELAETLERIIGASGANFSVGINHLLRGIALRPYHCIGIGER